MLGREKGVEGSHLFLEPLLNESESCRHWMSKVETCRTDDSFDWISCLYLNELNESVFLPKKSGKF